MDTNDDFKEIIEESGFEVGVNSDECVIYRTEHPNCFGCDYKIGCDKYVLIKLALLSSTLYTPKDYDDCLKMNSRIGENIKKILDAKTEEELKNIEV